MSARSEMREIIRRDLELQRQHEDFQERMMAYDEQLLERQLRLEHEASCVRPDCGFYVSMTIMYVAIIIFLVALIVDVVVFAWRIWMIHQALQP